MKVSFRKNLGIATGASVTSFAISLLLTPLMTRWYQPDDYGTFAVINNIATFLATAFLFSLPNALPLEPAWHKRAQLLRALVQLCAIAFVVTTSGVALFLLVTHVRGNFENGMWIFLTLPFLVLAIGTQRIAQGWANADGAFHSMAIARVVHPMVAKPSAIAASMLATSNPLYMIFFEGVAYFLQAIAMVRTRFHKLKTFPRLFARRSPAIVWGTLRRYRDFSLRLNLVNLLTLGSVALQTLILLSAYTAKEAGLFTLAMSMASLPLQLISMATASVIYHQLIACARNTPHELSRKVIKIFLAFILLGSLPYLVLFLFGPALFAFAFGQEWKESGSVASLFALPMFLAFLYTPISSIFRVTSSIKLQLRIDLIFVSATIVVFYLSVQKLAFIDAVTLFTAVVSVHQLVSIGSALYVAKNPKTQTPNMAFLK